MTTILFAIGLFGIAILAMAIGVLFGNQRPIKGSCGGVASGDPDASCSICGGSPEKCEGAQDKSQADPHYGSLHKALYKG